jgi:hypothetical protein
MIRVLVLDSIFSSSRKRQQDKKAKALRMKEALKRYRTPLVQAFS